MKEAGTYFLLALLLFAFEICRATITIDSVITTPSTCPNNGTAAIYAHSSSDSAVFLYNVIAGPVTYQQQNDSVFKSLYPGTYTAWVHDINSFDSTVVTFAITGNYAPPVYNPVAVAPFCEGGSDGMIIGYPVAGTGLAPYSWQIISPFTGPIRTGDTLGGLASGNYTVKLSDACGTAQIYITAVNQGGTGLAASYNGVVVNFTGCNTAIVYDIFSLNGSYKSYPVKLTIITGADTLIKSAVPVASGPNFQLSDTIFNAGYGNALTVCLTDTCGVTKCLQGNIPSFTYGLSASGSNCQYGLNYGFIQSNPAFQVNIPGPITVTLIDSATKAVVDSFICLSGTGCPSFAPQQPGETYLFTVKDTCGNIYKQTIHWPSASNPQAGASGNGLGCIDSTGAVTFTWNDFATPVTIKLLSGPAVMRSTTRRVAYKDTIVYPVTYANIPNTGSYSIGNLPPGNYTYKISDTCGYALIDSFRVNNVTQFSVSQSYSIACGNLATVCSNASVPLVWDLAYGTNNNYVGSLSTSPNHTYCLDGVLPAPGRWISGFFVQSNTDAILPGGPSCIEVFDTLIIPAANANTFKTASAVTCNDTSYLLVVADSNNSVLPLQYEILAGPETFSPQDSAIFMVHSFGTYLIGVIDGCGNVDTRQITVDTGRFDPVVKSGGWCIGSKVELADVASPYFSYIWHEPNGNVFTGDTLTISPFLPSDTGLYNITKIVTINGCSNSAHGSYQLNFRDTFQTAFSLCQGDTLLVGAHAHAVAGIYSDTLTGVDGCDSVAVSYLTFRPSYHPVIKDTICTGDTVYFAGLPRTQTGIYVNNLTAVDGCDSIITLYLQIDGLLLNDSITSNTCPGNSNGSITLTATSGYSPYLYSIDSLNYGASNMFTGLQGGPRTVSVRDAQGCMALEGVYVAGILPSSFVHVLPDTVCPGGSVRLNAKYVTFPCGIVPNTILNNTAIIGTGTLNQPGGVIGIPSIFGNFYQSNRQQILYNASELQNALGGPVTIGGIAFYVSQFNGNPLIDNLNVSMGCTNLDSLTDWVQGLSSVKTIASYTPYPAWNQINLDHQFCWDGVSNLVIELCSNDPITFGSQNNKAQCTLTNFTSYLYQCGNNNLCNSISQPLTSNYRPNIRLNFGPAPIDSSLRYMWTADSGGVVLNDTIVSPIGLANQTTEFIVRVSNAICQTSDSVKVFTAVGLPDSLRLAGNLCANDSFYFYGRYLYFAGAYDTLIPRGCDTLVTLNLTALAPVPPTYVYDTICSNDSLYFNGQFLTVGGVYNQSLKNSAGCDSVVTLSLTTRPIPIAAIAPDSCPVCHASPITFSASGGGSYRWNPGNYTTASITANPIAVTTYIVTVKDSNQCSAAASVIVYPTSDTILTINQSDTLVCSNQSVTFCAIQSFSSYEWNNTITGQCMSTSVPGSYWAIGANALGCRVVSDTLSFSIYQPTPVTVSVNGDTLTSYHDVSYQWYFNNNPIPGDTSISIVAQQSGSYVVHVTDSNGCTYFSTPIVITGINDTLISEQNIKVYPNPTGTTLFIKVRGKLPETFQLHTITGQLVYTGKFEPEINVANLNPGAYFIEIKSGELVGRKIFVKM